MTDYATFLERKTQLGMNAGFEPLWMPDFLFDFQKALVEWAIRKGRAAIFADCGLGKTPMQLVWAENIFRHTRKPVLILTPLAVGRQTKLEAEKFGMEAYRSQDGTVRPPITITNYERLHYFDPSQFAGVVCDESSILKHFAGATQKAVTRFMAKIPYRLLCTATAAPNDYYELGTSSEALGGLGHSDVLSRFFTMDDKKRCRMNDVKMAREANHNYFAKLSYRVAQQIGQWRLKGHAEIPFWKWVSSWARACRKPSDLGFSDAALALPPLSERHTIIMPVTAAHGMLFTLPAVGLQEERAERKRTMRERCEAVAGLVEHDRPVVVWCHTNEEGDRLEKMLPDCKQIAGRHDEEYREEVYEGFLRGSPRILIIKPKIGAWGMNWQHCSHVVTFASHSYEQYYQSVRRCWRFGQQRRVTVDIVATEGERYVIQNMVRKQAAMTQMFDRLVTYMHEAIAIHRAEDSLSVEVPTWLSESNSLQTATPSI